MIKKFYSALPAIILSTLIVVVLVLAWQEPTSPPPQGNVPAPLNTGNTAQSKTGTLRLGGLRTDFETWLATVSGNVGIGTTTPAYKLDVKGSINAEKIYVQGSEMGAGVKKLSELTIDSAPDAATAMNTESLDSAVWRYRALDINYIFSVISHPNLSEAKRVAILYASDPLGGKLPTLSGSWTTSPTSLGNITDSSATTTPTSGSVQCSWCGSRTGYINIDIGSKVHLRCITAKWTGSYTWTSGDNGCGGSIYLEYSADGTSWTSIVSGFSVNGTYLINAPVRYIRLGVFAGSGACSGVTTLSNVYFIL